MDDGDEYFAIDSDYSVVMEMDMSSVNEAVQIITLGLQNNPIPALARIYIENWIKEWSKPYSDDD